MSKINILVECATRFYRSQFPDLKVSLTPVPKPLARDEKADTAKPSARVKKSADGTGYSGTTTGSTVDALMKSIPLGAAHIEQRIIQGKERGPIPPEVLARFTDAWSAYNTPEIREAAQLMLNEVPPISAPTTVQVTCFLKGRSYACRVVAKTFSQTMLNLAMFSVDGVKIYVTEKNMETGENTETYAGTVFSGILDPTAPADSNLPATAISAAA